LDILDIFLQRIAVIVYGESRPCYFKDFIDFELNGVPYKYSHGTIRNTLSILRKQGKIEKTFNSIPAFYTLKGIKFGKPMTPNHTEDTFNYSQRNFFHFLGTMKVKKEQEVHDVNLGFKARALWNVASKTNSKLIANKDEKSNKDIILKKIFHDNLEITTKIHHTDNVSVLVGCTNYSVPIDYYGILRLTTGLSRAEERLRILYDEYLQSKDFKINNWIPSHMDWTVRMWHFNRDSAYTYGGPKFEIDWKDALGVFRVYSKKN
jgi:hypothetical protein